MGEDITTVFSFHIVSNLGSRDHILGSVASVCNIYGAEFTKIEKIRDGSYLLIGKVTGDEEAIDAVRSVIDFLIS